VEILVFWGMEKLCKLKNLTQTKFKTPGTKKPWGFVFLVVKMVKLNIDVES
jgi:hypothetical protein